ncbi:MAG: ribonuclease Z [Polyangiaceae bacterium]|nr:ribonuclease Z [Polyangiaceae bacterium]
MPRLTFVGTGEAFDPERPNTSLLYEGSLRLLLDCGYGVPHALWRTTEDPEALDAVYLTHEHADHAFGLPPLVVWMRVSGRRRPLHLLGGPGSRASIPRLLELGYEGAYDPGKCFPLVVEELSPNRPCALGGVTLTVAASAHSVPNHAIRIDDRGIGVAYSGDGAPTEATAALYRDVRCLVHECYGPSPAVTGHACFEDVLRCAIDANAEALHLVHIARDPEQRDRVIRLAASHAGPPWPQVPCPSDVIQLG